MELQFKRPWMKSGIGLSGSDKEESESIGYGFYHVYRSFGFHSRMLVRSKGLSAVECKNDA